MNPQFPSGRRVVLPKSVARSVRAIGFGLVLMGLYFGRGILAPLALAALIAFALAPAVRMIERMRLPRGFAVALVCGSVGALMVAAGLLVSLEVEGLVGELPRYQQSLEHKFRDARESLAANMPLRSVGQALHSLDVAMQNTTSVVTGEPTAPNASRVQTVRMQSGSGAEQLLQMASPYLSVLLQTGAVIILVIFMLIEWNDLRERIVRLADGNFDRAKLALCDASDRLRGYLGAQLMLNAAYGLVFGVALGLLGVPGAASWGILAGMLRFVPYAGPVVAGAAPLLMALVSEPGWAMGMQTAALVLVMELVTNNVLEPILYGQRAGLGTVAILISATFWTALWGPVGLVVATPISVCLATMGRHIPRLSVFHVLLGCGPVDRVGDPCETPHQPAANASPEPHSRRSPTAKWAPIRRHEIGAGVTVKSSL